LSTLTDIINARRRQQGGRTTLVEQLAPLQPLSTAELPEKIASLGHKVTRYNANPRPLAHLALRMRTGYS